MTTRYVEARLESAEFSCDKIQVAKIRGEETISRLFRFEIDFVTTDPSPLDVEGITGATATLVWMRDGMEIRRIHGMLSEVVQDLNAEADDAYAYTVTLVPHAHRLTLVEVQEIFLDMTVPAIITQKLETAGFSGAEMEQRLGGDYPQRDFVVQYKESDLAFVSRLAEHVGMSFFFEHEDTDKIVWSDSQATFPELPPALVRPRGEKMDVYSLTVRSKVIPAVYVVQDYNYRTPQVTLSSTNELQGAFGGGVVEYGGHFKTPAEGDALAKSRAEERQVTRMVYTGMSDLPGFTAGRRVTLTGPRSESLLLVSVKHEASFPTVIHGASGGENHYRNTFEAIPAEHTYRPPRVTPKPRIYGLVNAIIEHGIDNGVRRWSVLDDQGRYTVRFFFDTAEHSAKQSKPLRMLQPHSGPSYGMRFPLKPGMEVLIAFIDGDPDRPIISGATYRPDTPSPVADWNNTINKLKTESGVVIEIHDA
ncbi:MAG: type VI secretion system tip protein TssI/VgrG [Polyangiaceae bacterium]